jgi:hypothetical protein
MVKDDKLHPLEKWIMTNPLRAWLQRRYEATYLFEEDAA